MKQISLHAYDERYKRVYKNGADFWNEHAPHKKLLEIAKTMAYGSKCIDFGCGEGHEARAIAAIGLSVTAIDLSPIAINKAKNSTPDSLNVNYLVGDITNLTNLGIKDNSYKLAINVGSLHMMAEEEDRIAHLQEVKRILKDDGLFFLQNGLALDDVTPKSVEEMQIHEQLKDFFKNKPKSGEIINATVTTPEGEKSILLPLCPSGKVLTMKEYIIELESVGFTVIYSEQGGGANMAFEAIILAKA